MSKTVAKAAEEVVEATSVVQDLRGEVVINKLIAAFQLAKFAKFDPEALLEELTDIANDAAFDSEGFELDSTDGIADAVKHRFKLQALRDRLVKINQRLRESMSKIGRTYRLALVYLRQHDMVRSLTVKAQDEIAFAALREIADAQDNMKLVMDSVRDTLQSIDDKTRTLDAWFSLHKQYVFLALNRGPRSDGDEENSKAPKRLGKSRV